MCRKKMEGHGAGIYIGQLFVSSKFRWEGTGMGVSRALSDNSKLPCFTGSC